MKFICLLMLVSTPLWAKDIGPNFSSNTWANSKIWAPISKLISEQKYKAAKETLEKNKEDFVTNDKDWTIYIIQTQRLTMALGEAENSVEAFKTQDWPKSMSSNLLLELYYAQSLLNYYETYSWEINNREKVVSDKKLDLKKWTKAQIFTEIQKSLNSVYKKRAELGETKNDFFNAFIRSGNYPENIRGTLRDTLTYLYVDFLKNSQFWSAKEENEKTLLKLSSLLKKSAEKNALKNGAHPLQRINTILTDLENWHWKNDRIGGLIEARLEMVRVLKSHFNEDHYKKQMSEFLKDYLRDYKIDSWWSEGYYLRSELISEMSEPEALIKAIAIAKEAVKAHPKSIGANRANTLINNISQPQMSLQLLHWDTTGKKTITLKYKNWKNAYFRIYPFDPVKFFLNEKNEVLPSMKKMYEVLKNEKTVSEWSEELEELGDYREHKKHIIPKISKNGTYIIVASATEKFEQRENLISMAFLNLTKLNVMEKGTDKGKLLKVVDAITGAPLKNVELDLYERVWNKGTKKIKTLKSDQFGKIELSTDLKSKDNGSFFYTLKKGDDLLLHDNTFRLYTSRGRSGVRADKSLVFTDRSVYRPGQKIEFKVIAYTDKSQVFQMPKPLVKKLVVVSLKDGNGQLVETKKLESNEFGTVSGEFEIPKGRFLGHWRIDTRPNGSATIKVEEYKRPTFLVQLGDAIEEIRMNKKASFKGEVKYYFGLPVDNAKVRYKIKRTTNYPYWYGWWFRPQNNSEQIVKLGTTKTAGDGSFNVSFIPRADKSIKGLTYNYSVSVEVLNEGGETATDTKNFIIGDIAISAIISHNETFFSGKKIEASISRQDLNGKPLAGTGKAILYRLREPNETVLPSEQALFFGKNKPTKFKTEGDLTRSRWEPEFEASSILETWENGERIKSFDLIHNDSGMARLDIKNLTTGSYRIVYKSKDKFGSEYETHSNFMVLGKDNMKLPILLEVSQSSAQIGDVVKIWVKSGLKNQKVFFELYINDKRIMNEIVNEQKLFKYKVAKRDLGGISIRVYGVIDHQFFQKQKQIYVPYVSKELELSWQRIRKEIYPGVEEQWSLKVKAKDEKGKIKELNQAAEVLVYMFDKSLDSYMPHYSQSFYAYPHVRMGHGYHANNYSRSFLQDRFGWSSYDGIPVLYGSRLSVFDAWPIGGFGYFRSRGGYSGGMMYSKGMVAEGDFMEMSASNMDMVKSAPMKKMRNAESKAIAPSISAKAKEEGMANRQSSGNSGEAQSPKTLRENFNETAFFKPHLLTNKNGEVEVKFKVPDNLTSYHVISNAFTKDLSFGSLREVVKAKKDLMTRIYAPRFLRQGDKAIFKVIIDNASEENLTGDFKFELMDEAGDSLAEKFKLGKNFIEGVKWEIKAKSSQSFKVQVEVPKNSLGILKYKAMASTDKFTDGELKELPVLPSKIHLAQSRFVTLKNKESRTLKFEDMKKINADHEALVVKLDAQLFYSVLSALPYIVDYPYECSEQTVNKYVTTAILSQSYKEFPNIAKMAQKMSKRETQFEAFDGEDPNRKMTLEETPWLKEAKGEGADPEDLLNMLKPKMVKYQKDTSLRKVLKLQNSDGGFSWFQGGDSSVYMTQYVLHSFAKASEFGVEVPKSNIQKGFRFLKKYYDEEISRCYVRHGCWEWLVYLNFILSTYPDDSYYAASFSKADRDKMLNYTFDHWKKIQPMMKGMLALTLKREKRDKDAVLVLESVMDSAKEEKDLGVYWAPEDRSWLWYNDTIETHAFALMALMEVMPKDQRKHGLVQWLFLNKKLNHWKSTKATSEVMYALLKYLKAENLVGSKERANIEIGDIKKDFEFDPSEYTGANNFVVVEGKDIKPDKMSEIKVTQETKGMMFASATWHFATEELPKESRGDFFKVERKYYKRVAGKEEMKLMPLAEGAKISIGDQVEVHISISAKHASQYVHLKDPRPAGFEPENPVSGYRWDLGLIRYQEVRDSGVNFFFERLPVGEYTLKHRLRANIAGRFRTHPAMLQSVYAPEFVGYSTGKVISIE